MYEVASAFNEVVRRNVSGEECISAANDNANIYAAALLDIASKRCTRCPALAAAAIPETRRGIG